MSTDKAATAPVRKFMFDYSFDEDAVANRPPERKPILLKPEQYDALKKESYDEGFKSGKVAGLDEQIAQQNAALTSIGRNIAELMRNLSGVVEEHENHARCLALAVVKKVLPSYIEKYGLQEIEALVDSTLREVAREPRLVIRVHEAEFDALNDKFQELAQQRAFSGQMVVLADGAVAPGDCRIEWTNGGVARDTAAIMDAVEQILLPPSE